MADYPAEGSHAYPRDLGSDAPEGYVQQDSAGFVGGLARHRTFLDYVEAGMEINPDWGGGTLDVESGLAHLLVEGTVTVEDQTGTYAPRWRNGMGVAIDTPAVTDLPLESDTENHVYLAYRPQRLDAPASFEINTTDAPPAVPSSGAFLKLAVVDTASQAVRLEDPYLGMSAEFGTVHLAKTTESPDSATRREWVLDRLSALRSDLTDALDVLSERLTSHANSDQAHGSNGAVAGQADVNEVQNNLDDHAGSDQAHASNGSVAGMDDLYTDDEARRAVDGSDVSVRHAKEADHAETASQADNAARADFAQRANQADQADYATEADHASTADSAAQADQADQASQAEQADDATLWDGYEIVFDGEEPSSDQYIRFETE